MLQRPAEGPVIDGGEFVLHGPYHLTHRLACGPAPDTGDSIRGQNRFAIMEFQPRPQAERPDQAIRRGFFGLNHLPLRLQVAVDPVQRIPDQECRIARDIGRGPDRIEIGEIRMRHEAHGARTGALREGGFCKSTRRSSNRCARPLQEYPAVHAVALCRAQAALPTPQKNGNGPLAMPLTFLRQA